MRLQPNPGERGIALFVSIFALLLLSAVAMGLMYLADTETNINYNYRASQQAVAAAHAGLQEVRQRLTLAAGEVALIPAGAPSVATARSVLYVTNAPPGVTVDPTDLANRFFDAELCHENFIGLAVTNPGPNVPCPAAPIGMGWADASLVSTAPFANTAQALSYRWVRITWKVNASNAVAGFPATSYYVNAVNDPTTRQTAVCWDGVHEILLPAGATSCEQPIPPATQPPPRTQVYMLTALAVTETGARRMVQMEVANDPPMQTRAALESKATVVAGGTVDVYGWDHCSCDCTKDEKTGEILSCKDRPPRTCDKSKYAIYTNGTVNEQGGPTIEAPTTPEYAEGAPWLTDIPAMIERYRYKSDTVNPSDACVTGGPQPCGWACTGPECGTYANPFLGVPPLLPPMPVDSPADNPALGPQSRQTTYIPGNVRLSNFVGSGVLVIDGDLELSGHIDFYGLILVRGVISFTGGAAGINIFGSVLSGEESKLSSDVMGNVNISYDYCALPQQDRNQPPLIIVSRELNY